MPRSQRAVAGLLATLCWGAACGATDEPDRPPAPAPPPVRALASRFSPERAWAHLEALMAMGPRAPGLPGHARARAYLREQLEFLGARVEETPFEYQPPGETVSIGFRNVSGRLGSRTGAWLLLGTHYDTRLWADRDPAPERRTQPVPGANDGGSGVAVLLEVARIVAEEGPPLGVEIAFFDGEDYGRASPDEYALGARHLVANWERLRPGPRPEAVVVVDMVGDADLALRPERSGARAFPELNQRLWAAAARLGERAFDASVGGPIVDDHTPFLEAGMPAALLIDLDYPAWHTSADTLERCAPRSLAAVGRVLLEALFDEPARSARGTTQRSAPR